MVSAERAEYKVKGDKYDEKGKQKKLRTEKTDSGSRHVDRIRDDAVERNLCMVHDVPWGGDF